ncbi:MAG: PorV/PorQ family protein, partial [Paludibacteraceae bacterium]|nr:PorV/PorQ family protein [Paludibacteraceae bacterium]
MRPIITAVPSLTVNADARAGGMGEAGAATSPDANSQYWNPSKYVFSESSAGFVINYTPWMKKIVDDINLLYAAGYWKFGEMQSVSASLRYFGMGDITVTDENGKDMGSTSPYELSVDVAYARKLSERWAAAVALRYIRVDFGTVEGLYPGNAFAADIAASYRMPL